MRGGECEVMVRELAIALRADRALDYVEAAVGKQPEIREAILLYRNGALTMCNDMGAESFAPLVSRAARMAKEMPE